MEDMTAHEQDLATKIAIVGMSGRFPGANDTQTFWNNLSSGVKSIRFFSDEELLSSHIDPALLANPNYVKAGAPVEGADQFDAEFFGFTPREAEIRDPQHRLFLECCWEAFEDAAYDPGTYPGMVGVFAGSAFPTYLVKHIHAHPELIELLGELQIGLGNERDALASLVSYKLNLRGPGIAIQTFCSTSLVATHLACQSLLNYECDMALAGGVAISFPQEGGYLYQEGGIVSPDGECRALDARGAGSVMGNGVGVVLLKRLEDALTDNDHIYAVICGSATNNDGKMRVSYTAPGLDGQAAVIAEGIANAGINPETISYIETHGTGTRLGDSIELAALMKAFSAKTAKKHFCALGSLKPNIGHLDRASGVSGLIKAALALKHKQIPPSLNFERPNPEIGLEQSPFYVNTKLTEWETNGHPRRAGVNSFGLGGTNAHVVLEEAPELAPSDPSHPWQLLTLSARSLSALDQQGLRLADHLRQHPDLQLADVAFTLQVGRAILPYRRTLLCQDREHALSLLSQPTPPLVASRWQEQRDRPVAFLLPGLGEIYPGVLYQLTCDYPLLRNLLDEGGDLLQSLLGEDLRPWSSPTPTFPIDGLPTVWAQPLTFLLEFALAQLLASWGIHPAALLGYSVGEYVAACLAGLFDWQEGLRLLVRRAQLIEEYAQPGGLLAVALSAEQVHPYLSEDIELSAITGAFSCVLGGPSKHLTHLQQHLLSQGIAARPVQARHAFHTSLLRPAALAWKQELSHVRWQEPHTPWISNLTGDWISPQQAIDPGYWAEQMCRPVQFAQGVQRLLEKPEWLLVEVGPGQTLSSYAKMHPACSEERRQEIVPTVRGERERSDDQTMILTMLSKLWLGGVSLNWTDYWSTQKRLRLSLPTYPFERQRFWVEGVPLQTEQTHKQDEALATKKPDLADWFYLPTWKRTRPPFMSELAAPELPEDTWLVLSNQTSFGLLLIDSLIEQGQSVIHVEMNEYFTKYHGSHYAINPTYSEDYSHLLKELGYLPRRIVHLWNLQSQGGADARTIPFEQAQERGFYSLLFLTQAIGKQYGAEAFNIWAFSQNAYQVTGGENLQPEQATLGGACKVISQENPNALCHHIDITLPVAETWQEERLVAQLIADFQNTSAPSPIVYRGNERWMQIFEPTRLEMPEKGIGVLRQRGVYLITGGFGGVGHILADYLARNWKACLVLIGRTPFPTRDQWDIWQTTHGPEDHISQKIERLRGYEALGSELLICNADVAEEKQMQSVINQIYAQFGQLNGVIHAAGISDESAFVPVQEMSLEICEKHFRPKVQGLFVLEKLVGNRPLDFCICFSSLSSVLGGLGFSAYTAANMFMDSFVHKHNLIHEKRWLSVNWDTWRFQEEDQQSALGRTIAKYEKSPREGIASFERILASGNDMTCIVESTGDLEHRLDQWIRKVGMPTQDAASAELHQRPELANSYIAPRNEIEQRVTEAWQAILGVTSIGITDNFLELGGNSLLGTQLAARLRQLFRVNIPLTVLFDAPTIAEMALAIENIIIDEIEKLDEEDAALAQQSRIEL